MSKSNTAIDTLVARYSDFLVNLHGLENDHRSAKARLESLEAAITAESANLAEIEDALVTLGYTFDED